MKRVLHLLPSDRFSGAENVVCQIIDMFCNSDEYEMVYCSPAGPIQEILAARGISFFALEDFSFKSIKKVIESYRPDIVHAHDMRACVWAATIPCKAEVIGHIHNNSFNSRKISVKTILFACAALRIKRIIWVSEAAFKGFKFHSFFQRKSVKLNNIIDIEKIRKKASEDKSAYKYDVVYLGRFTYPKNPHRLIDVLERVVAKKPSVQVGLIGTGELEEEIKCIAAKKGLLSNLTFMGFQTNPYGVLRDAKAMLMTSRWEGLPMCVLEAMSLGVPVVSTPTDGICDVVIHDVNGYLENSDEALADRILELLDCDKLRKEFSRNACVRAEQLTDIEAYKSTLRKVYGG